MGLTNRANRKLSQKCKDCCRLMAKFFRDYQQLGAHAANTLILLKNIRDKTCRQRSLPAIYSA